MNSSIFSVTVGTSVKITFGSPSNPSSTEHKNPCPAGTVQIYPEDEKTNPR
jgi:hypothetical protein